MVDLLGTLLNGAVTLAAAFGGYALAGRNQRATDRRAANLDREKHSREMSARLAEDRHQDQLKLLRTVQEELHEVTRNLASIVNADLEIVELGGESSALPTGLSARDHEARIRLAMHSSRVLDDEVRHMAERLNGSVADFVLPSLLSMDLTIEQARTEAHRRLADLMALAQPAIERAGRAVRDEALWEPAG